MFFNASTCTVEGNAHLARCLMRMPLGAWASRPRPAYRVIIIIAGEKYAFSTGRGRDAHAPRGYASPTVEVEMLCFFVSLCLKLYQQNS